ncbi:MAG: hypothetical protein E6J90_18460 [Deltaproteobacteria bacterium]|nr:MAG: hypothetical protein E6J91_14310 [Deltaproteobacteria bacterium]TMQ19293.1 MAG: hypothetical protein E6J90_18460 [Deltaproteobacteria bacterium]
MKCKSWSCVAVLGALCALTGIVDADRRFVLATGRRDPRIYAIDLREALRPANNNTSARPKGTAVTSDGRFAVVTGGANTLPSPTPTGTVFVLDLATNQQVATVTGVGIDPYNLVVVERAGDDD